MKGLIIGIIVVVVLAIAGYFVLNTGNYNTDQGGAIGDKMMTDSGTDSSSANTGLAEAVIDIQDFTFSPGTLTISVGASVTWMNLDSAPHSIKSDSGSELNSNLLGNGDSYSHTFTQAGTYEYHCGVHPMMKGKIIVQ